MSYAIKNKFCETLTTTNFWSYKTELFGLNPITHTSEKPLNVITGGPHISDYMNIILYDIRKFNPTFRISSFESLGWQHLENNFCSICIISKIINFKCKMFFHGYRRITAFLSTSNKLLMKSKPLIWIRFVLSISSRGASLNWIP